MKLALRTQQVVAEETGVHGRHRPPGRLLLRGGAHQPDRGRGHGNPAQGGRHGRDDSAIEEGYFQREIADTAYEFARRKASGEQPVIGVNTHVEPYEPPPIPIHRVDAAVEARQVAAVKAVRARRDGPRVAALLDRLAAEAQDPAVNLMPTTIELVKARATLGEIVARLRDVFGRYVERPVF